ncbi:SGNH/GDSL hydrolase family protein [Streptomyces sp. NPDC054933]
MRFIRLVAAVCALPLAAAATLLGTDAAGATGSAYAALGDSYSAGVGAGDYLGSSGACERSAKAYPRLWADAHAPSSFAFTACDGATTTDVTNNQLGPLNQSTSLVSITVGADDAGFGRVMTTCVLSSDTACLSRIVQAEDYIRGTLPARLDHVYSAIRAKAPAAHVVVLGYPRFYKVNGLCRAGMSEAKRSAVNQAADEVDSVIARRAADHGFTFRDVRPAFAPHEICGGDPWLHSVTIPVGDSYHPTARGQSGGYLPEFTAVAS